MFKPSRGPVGECIVCTFIAACVPPPTDNTYELMGFLNLFLVLAHIPQPSQSIRFRHFAENENEFTGRNVYS